MLPRHQHAKPYVTLVLQGAYVEAGDQGRFRVEPGDVLSHEGFSSHANWIDQRNDVHTLNFELSTVPPIASVGFSSDVDAVVKLAETDLTAAVTMLLQSVRPKAASLSDWPEILAKAIRDDPSKSVSYWCRTFGLAAGTVSRGFKRAFGVSAAQYRATARARNAYRALVQSDIALVDIAGQFDFSDQAHFTRSIRALTGAPPGYWRGIKNIQDSKPSRT